MKPTDHDRTVFFVSRQDRTQPLSVVGEHITVLASAAQTGGYKIFFQAGPEGSGPPPHKHPWDDAFYVLRGEVAFGVGDRESLAVEGTLVQVPGGTTHWFRYANSRCRIMRSKISETMCALWKVASTPSILMAPLASARVRSQSQKASFSLRSLIAKFLQSSGLRKKL